MSEERRVRDPIHGFIRLSSDEAEIVETTAFQRLRGIRQLAMANLVYPGALHTRFDHTLGVFHVTGLLCDVFRFPDEDKRLVRLSALLHDLGHGPFSHVSEGPYTSWPNFVMPPSPSCSCVAFNCFSASRSFSVAHDIGSWLPHCALTWTRSATSLKRTSASASSVPFFLPLGLRYTKSRKNDCSRNHCAHRSS